MNHEKQETLAEIVAEYRQDADAMDRGWLYQPTTEYLRRMLDRIEAAAKREPIGNSAATREALEELMKFTCNSCERRLCEDDAEEEDGQRVPSLCSAIIRARNALAAPPRNCDMPLVVDGPADNNADKAWLVFKKHNPDAYFDVPGLLRCIDWLLAPSTERKGETNGK